MPILADTNAVIHESFSTFIDDPAVSLPGWPGTSGKLQSRKSNFTFTNLGTTVKRYAGITTKADMIRLAEFYVNTRAATVDCEEGPTYAITVNLPYDEITNLDADPTRYTLWEVTPNAAERDIFEVGIFSPTVQNGQISSTRLVVNNTIKGAIEQAYKNPLQTINLTVQPAWASAQYLAENYLALKRLKADGVSGFTQTVKRTVVINTLFNDAFDPIAENPANGNVNPLIATPDLIAQYNVPENIQIHLLPSYARPKTVSGQDAVTLNILAGYLIKKPTYQQVTPNKIQLTQEFVWDEWLDSHYRPWDGNYGAFV